MTEYIEREHLKDKFTRYLNAPHVRGGYSIGQGMRVAIETCIAMLDEEHTVEVEPVRHGTWEPCFEDWRKQIEGDKCSACGFEHYGCSIRAYRYCPNCGARMDGGADNG